MEVDPLPPDHRGEEEDPAEDDEEDEDEDGAPGLGGYIWDVPTTTPAKAVRRAYPGILQTTDGFRENFRKLHRRCLSALYDKLLREGRVRAAGKAAVLLIECRDPSHRDPAVFFDKKTATTNKDHPQSRGAAAEEILGVIEVLRELRAGAGRGPPGKAARQPAARVEEEGEERGMGKPGPSGRGAGGAKGRKKRNAPPPPPITRDTLLDAIRALDAYLTPPQRQWTVLEAAMVYLVEGEYGRAHDLLCGPSPLAHMPASFRSRVQAQNMEGTEAIEFHRSALQALTEASQFLIEYLGHARTQRDRLVALIPQEGAGAGGSADFLAFSQQPSQQVMDWAAAAAAAAAGAAQKGGAGSKRPRPFMGPASQPGVGGEGPGAPDTPDFPPCFHFSRFLWRSLERVSESAKDKHRVALAGLQSVLASPRATATHVYCAARLAFLSGDGEDALEIATRAAAAKPLDADICDLRTLLLCATSGPQAAHADRGAAAGRSRLGLPGPSAGGARPGARGGSPEAAAPDGRRTMLLSLAAQITANPSGLSAGIAAHKLVSGILSGGRDLLRTLLPSSRPDAAEDSDLETIFEALCTYAEVLGSKGALGHPLRPPDGSPHPPQTHRDAYGTPDLGALLPTGPGAVNREGDGEGRGEEGEGSDGDGGSPGPGPSSAAAKPNVIRPHLPSFQGILLPPAHLWHCMHELLWAVVEPAGQAATGMTMLAIGIEPDEDRLRAAWRPLARILDTYKRRRLSFWRRTVFFEGASAFEILARAGGVEEAWELGDVGPGGAEARPWLYKASLGGMLEGAGSPYAKSCAVALATHGGDVATQFFTARLQARQAAATSPSLLAASEKARTTGIFPRSNTTGVFGLASERMGLIKPPPEAWLRAFPASLRRAAPKMPGGIPPAPVPVRHGAGGEAGAGPGVGLGSGAAGGVHDSDTSSGSASGTSTGTESSGSSEAEDSG